MGGGSKASYSQSHLRVLGKLRYVRPTARFLTILLSLAKIKPVLLYTRKELRTPENPPCTSAPSFPSSCNPVQGCLIRVIRDHCRHRASTCALVRSCEWQMKPQLVDGSRNTPSMRLPFVTLYYDRRSPSVFSHTPATIALRISFLCSISPRRRRPAAHTHNASGCPSIFNLIISPTQ